MNRNPKGQFIKGHVLPEKTRRKMSESHKGVKLSEKHRKGVIRGLTGKRHSKETRRKLSKALNGRIFSEETKRKMSEAHKGKRLGEKNNQWLGGISFEPYGLEFNKKLKEIIRKRDKYICQECKHSQERLGYRLSVHHIDYDKKNNVEDNLISLCRACHQQTNFNREDWTDYFVGKITDELQNS